MWGFLDEHLWWKHHSKYIEKKNYQNYKHTFEHTRKLFRTNKILNLFQLITSNNVIFMDNFNKNSVSDVFHRRFQKPSHSYSIRFPVRVISNQKIT